MITVLATKIQKLVAKLAIRKSSLGFVYLKLDVFCNYIKLKGR